MKAEIVISHLTCHMVGFDEDAPIMLAEDDHSHGEVMKFFCPRCNHKLTLDLIVTKEGS